MDTSETYIKMRLAAIPDLGMGKPPSLPLDGDVAWVDVSVFADRLGSFYYSSVNIKPLGEEITCCQLERQDQFQAMSGIKFSIRLFHEFVRWLDTTKIGYYEEYSGEQLWLFFVMEWKFSKKWGGNEWVV